MRHGRRSRSSLDSERDPVVKAWADVDEEMGLAVFPDIKGDMSPALSVPKADAFIQTQYWLD